MENKLEQFRMATIPIITREEKWSQKEGSLEKLRFKFIQDLTLDDEEKQNRINQLLYQIQLNSAEVSEENAETALHRFKFASEILIIVNKPDQDLLNKLTELAGSYVRYYRRSKTGGLLSQAVSEEDESKVRSFYEKLVEIQRDLYQARPR